MIVLLLGPSRNDPDLALLLSYLKSSLHSNWVSETDLDPYEVITRFINSSNKSSKESFEYSLLVELRFTESLFNNPIIKLHLAIVSNWRVVISASSGNAWHLQVLNQPQHKFLAAMMNKFFTLCYAEHNVFHKRRSIEVHEINKKREYSLSEITGWNPLLLSCFRDVSHDEKQFRRRKRADYE